MSDEEFQYFQFLKEEVASTFRKTFTYATGPIEEWKGQEITDLQEELLKKVKGQLSEKWFYTHVKNNDSKLPRIDMLNMLSEYVGCRNWKEFKEKNKKRIYVPDHSAEEMGDIQITYDQPVVNPGPAEEETAPVKKKSKNTWWIFVLLAMAVAMIVLLNTMNTTPELKTFTGSLVDITGSIPAGAEGIEVQVFKENESPVLLNCDSAGHFKIESGSSKIRFLIRSPYYSTDTITRILNEVAQSEKIKVRTDDYALMIHYFSTSKVSDWKKRRAQLENMISNDARIYQVFENSGGLELYNKAEFVNRMTMPLKSLKNVEIIETEYTGGQISTLKFKLSNIEK